MGRTAPATSVGTGHITYTSQLPWSDTAASCTETRTAAPASTSASSGTFPMGSVGSFAETASGHPIPTVAEPGVLPTGVTLAHGLLAGAPAAGRAAPLLSPSG